MDHLLRKTSSFRGKPALFDETPNSLINGVPGSLHHASDDHIRSLVNKSGAVVLVRQLAQDVAERDAEITSIRRRAEERERELKKMLREAEVSNLDIETRLHRIENARKSPSTGGSRATFSPQHRPMWSAGMSRTNNLTNGIDAMMGEAMGEDLGRLELEEGYIDSLPGDDRHATVKVKNAQSREFRESDGQSITSSLDSQGRPRGTTKGWKDYLWSGSGTSRKTSKASSVISDHDDDDEFDAVRTRGASKSNAGRRKGLDDDLFQPLARASTMDHPSQPRKSSTSVTSWTMKLFAGNPNSNREQDKPGTSRSRSNTTGNEPTRGSRSGSTASGPPPRTAKAALMKVSSMERVSRQQRKPTPVSAANQRMAAKSSIPPVPPLPTSPARAENVVNLGPVEMDTIHPPESKPPTLLQNSDNTSDDLLTDRYGFIYDQRRRKKAAEAIFSHQRGKSNASVNVKMIDSARASMKSPPPGKSSQPSDPSQQGRPDTPLSNEGASEERPTNRWQDYLKIATFPTELLSDSPISKPNTKVISTDVVAPSFKRMTTTADARASLSRLSSNLEPEMSPVTAGKAEMSRAPTTTSAKDSTSAVVEEEPVKLLLAQLTELHDNLQREKSTKWNDFLRKVMAERKREGEMITTSEGRSIQAAMPEVKLNDGELIGVAGLGNTGKVGRAKWKTLKQLVLGGIPIVYRPKIWAECSGAAALRVPGYYDDLVKGDSSDASIVSQIQMDIYRTLTDNVFFRKGQGVVKLNEVLMAYSRRNPEVGYCQGMNMIAGSLLLIMPTAEEAFWVLTSLIENILPQHYYDQSLLASRADQQVLREYVAEILPKLWAHLVELEIELDTLTFQWFLSVYTDCLSAEALFRVWDVIFVFNDGSTFLFQVALALLKLNEGQLLECDSAARIYSYIGNEMTDHAISIDGLISASDALKNVITRKDVEDRRWRAIEQARAKERRGRGSMSTSSAGSNMAELVMQEPRPFEGVNGEGKED